MLCSDSDANAFLTGVFKSIKRGDNDMSVSQPSSLYCTAFFRNKVFFLMFYLFIYLFVTSATGGGKRLCFHPVCLFVCVQDISKSCVYIRIKFGGQNDNSKVRELE